MSRTRKALEQLSKGEKVYTGDPVGPLAPHVERFKAAAEAEQRRIVAKKNADTVQMPFVQVLRRKVASAMEAPSPELPVAMKVDFYSEIRRTADRNPRDNGLAHLAHMVKDAFQKDPGGVFKYAELERLRSHLASNFPRSKAVSALNFVAGQVGMHKLPVAKIARAAKNIESQADYDNMVVSLGFAGHQPNQIRARALLRELVNLRGANVIATDAERDTRSAAERVADRIGREAQEIPPEAMPELPPEAPAEDGLGEGLDALPTEPEVPAADGDVEMGAQDTVPLLEQIEQEVQDTVEQAPPDVEPYLEHERAEGHTGEPGTATWGFEEAMEGHEAPPPSEEWLNEEMQEIEGGGPEGMPVDLEQSVDEHAAMKTAGFSAQEVPEGWEKMAGKFEEIGLQDPVSLTAWMKERGFSPKLAADIPVPSMPPEQDPNDAPEMKGAPVSSNAGNTIKAFTMTASEVEEKLLGLESVEHAGYKLAFNAENEIEFSAPNGDVKAAILDNMDIVVADFLAVTAAVDKKTNEGKLSRVAFSIDRLFYVPCAGCGQATAFKYLKNASKGDSYKCGCGHVMQAQEAHELATAAGAGEVYKIDVGPAPAKGVDQDMAWLQGNERSLGKQQMEQAKKVVNQLLAGQGRINDEGDHVSVELWNVDSTKVQDIAKKLQGAGLKLIDSKRIASFLSKWAQMANPPGAGGMPPAGEGHGPAKNQEMGKPKDPADATISPSQAMNGMDPVEVLRSSLVTYKAEGMSYPQAMSQIYKKYKDFFENHSKDIPELDHTLAETAAHLWGQSRKPDASAPSTTPPTQQPPPMPVTGALTMKQVAERRIAEAKEAAGRMKTPSVRKPEDHVKGLGKVPGKDLSQEDPFKTPSVKTKHPEPGAKNKNLGEDTETRSEIPTPGKPSTHHDMGMNRGVNLPKNKDLGPDSDTHGTIPTPSHVKNK